MFCPHDCFYIFEKLYITIKISLRHWEWTEIVKQAIWQARCYLCEFFQCAGFTIWNYGNANTSSYTTQISLIVPAGLNLQCWGAIEVAFCGLKSPGLKNAYTEAVNQTNEEKKDFVI